MLQIFSNSLKSRCRTFHEYNENPEMGRAVSTWLWLGQQYHSDVSLFIPIITMKIRQKCATYLPSSSLSS